MNETWREFANCKGEDINKFFDQYERSAATQLEVDTMCGNCVVRKQCLEWALANGAEGGVFGRKFIPQVQQRKKKEPV